MAAPSLLPCTIAGPDRATVCALAEIAATCSRDLAVPLELRTSVVRERAAQSPADPVLTLHLPVELAASQHQVWCLACRLACFCPSVRVSVLVHGENFFAASSLTRAKRQRSA